LPPERIKELLIKSILSFPQRRESMRNKVLDPRLRGDDELISASLKGKLHCPNRDLSHDKVQKPFCNHCTEGLASSAKPSRKSAPSDLLPASPGPLLPLRLQITERL